jgi:hypothetical protein
MLRRSCARNIKLNHSEDQRSIFIMAQLIYPAPRRGLHLLHENLTLHLPSSYVTIAHPKTQSKGSNPGCLPLSVMRAPSATMRSSCEIPYRAVQKARQGITRCPAFSQNRGIFDHWAVVRVAHIGQPKSHFISIQIRSCWLARPLRPRPFNTLFLQFLYSALPHTPARIQSKESCNLLVKID